MNTSSKKYFKTLVDPLGLTVYLRVIRGACEQGGGVKFEQFLLKPTCKNLVAV
jgi:hypothetical protein